MLYVLWLIDNWGSDTIGSPFLFEKKITMNKKNFSKNLVN